MESCRAGVEFEIWVSGFLVGQHEEVQVLSHVVQVSISDADGLNMSKPTICNRDKFGVEWSYIYKYIYTYPHSVVDYPNFVGKIPHLPHCETMAPCFVGYIRTVSYIPDVSR